MQASVKPALSTEPRALSSDEIVDAVWAIMGAKATAFSLDSTDCHRLSRFR